MFFLVICITNLWYVCNRDQCLIGRYCGLGLLCILIIDPCERLDFRIHPKSYSLNIFAVPDGDDNVTN